MAYTEEQKREHIRELQTYLHGLSHVQDLPRVAPDGIYGPKTAAAVREFQQKNQLRPNGAANTATWNALVEAYLDEVVPPLNAVVLFPAGICSYSLGDKGASVYLIQGILQAIQSIFPQLPPVQANGVFDNTTAHAVQEFQKLTSAPPSGEVDAATWNRLVAALDNEVNVMPKRESLTWD